MRRRAFIGDARRVVEQDFARADLDQQRGRPRSCRATAPPADCAGHAPRTVCPARSAATGIIDRGAARRATRAGAFESVHGERHTAHGQRVARTRSASNVASVRPPPPNRHDRDRTRLLAQPTMAPSRLRPPPEMTLRRQPIPRRAPARPLRARSAKRVRDACDVSPSRIRRHADTADTTVGAVRHRHNRRPDRRRAFP